MRTDVKLGVAFALVMVLAAGGYFMFRGDKQKPISLADKSATDLKTQPIKPAVTPSNPAPTNANRPAIKPNSVSTTTGTAMRPGTPTTTPTTTPIINKPIVPQPASGTAENPAAAPPRPTGPAGATPAPTGMELPSTVAGNSGPASNPVERPAMPAASPTTTTTPGPAVAERPSTPTTGSPVGLTGIPNASQPHVPTSRPSTGLASLTNAPSNAVTPTVPAPSNANLGSTLPPGIKTATAPKVDTAPSKGNLSADAAVDTHKVQVGDSLSSLAQTYYGDSKYAKVLADANPKLGDPNHLKVGSIVNIPPLPPDAGSKTSNGNATAAKPGEKSADGKRTYTVKAGDSFYSIAKSQLGNASRWKELLALNTAVVKGDPTALQPGQRLVLPESH